MRTAPVLLLVVGALAGARAARSAIATLGDVDSMDQPYTPSPVAAPIVVLGYREAAADLLFIRFTGYFGSLASNATDLAAMIEAIVALDPSLHRAYEYGAMAISAAPKGTSNATALRAIAVLDRGSAQFPDDWNLPHLAAEIYTQDLVTKDPAQRRVWDEKGTDLMEAAIRKPGAPPTAATWIAEMRSRLGQHQRAVAGLREMILITSDSASRQRLIDRLAALEKTDEHDLAIELDENRRRFEREWLGARPLEKASFYLLIGPRLQPGFDLAELAMGGRELVDAPAERLEPVE